MQNDPYMLLCIVNTKLRDFYADLDQLIDDLEYNKEELVDKLSLIGYTYNKEHNKFVPK